MKKVYPLLSLSALAALSSYAQQRPNIIYIMCDDMGYGDLGCYGQQYISTPFIDNMASEGMRFTQAYAGSPVSAPSRATLMTGQHSGHTHVRGNKEYWRGKDIPNLYGKNTDFQDGWAGQEPYDAKHLILPEIFKKNGYTTGMFGKWAGGYESSESTPDKRGIDEYFGYICQFEAHAYYPNFLNAFSRSAGDTQTHRVTLEENIKYGMPTSTDYSKRPQYSADLIHQKAMEWLDKQSKDQPFLGIFTYTLPHAELAQPEDSILQAYKNHFCQEHKFAGQAGNRYHGTEIAHAQFAAMITRLDAYVGQILAKLKEKGIDENTIVIFTSDNGPHEEGGADPTFFNRDGLLQGLKRSTYEGGIRIPFIVRWPGRVAPGKVNDHQFAFYDLLPTFCDVAGIHNFPQAYLHDSKDCYDGISIYPTLTGNDEAQKSHDALYWEFHETNMLGVRMGDWKLVVKDGKCRLYNLKDDLHEDHDIATQHRDIVKKMVDIIHREHTKPDFEMFNVTLPSKIK